MNEIINIPSINIPSIKLAQSIIVGCAESIPSMPPKEAKKDTKRIASELNGAAKLASLAGDMADAALLITVAALVRIAARSEYGLNALTQAKIGLEASSILSTLISKEGKQ